MSDSRDACNEWKEVDNYRLHYNGVVVNYYYQNICRRFSITDILFIPIQICLDTLLLDRTVYRCSQSSPSEFPSSQLGVRKTAREIEEHAKLDERAYRPKRILREDSSLKKLQWKQTLLSRVSCCVRWLQMMLQFLSDFSSNSKINSLVFGV